MKYMPTKAESPVNLNQSKLLATVIKPIMVLAKMCLTWRVFQVQYSIRAGMQMTVSNSGM